MIDFSFWSKENRNFYKELIRKADAETELVYMKASKELLQKRLYKRNQVLNANSPFVITDKILEHHLSRISGAMGRRRKSNFAEIGYYQCVPSGALNTRDTQNTLLHSSASRLTSPKHLDSKYLMGAMPSTSRKSHARRRTAVQPRLRLSTNLRVDSTKGG